MTSCRRGGGGVRVRMTNNVEGCIKKHDKGGGGGLKKMPQNSMTSFMDDPIDLNIVIVVCATTYSALIISSCLEYPDPFHH